MDKKRNEPAELMLRLFEGYDKRHIQMCGNMAADDKGKVNGKPAYKPHVTRSAPTMEAAQEQRDGARAAVRDRRSFSSRRAYSF